MTNFEKTKQEISEMSVEEFSKNCDQYLCGKIPIEHCDKYSGTVIDCNKCKIDWLKSEVEE